MSSNTNPLLGLMRKAKLNIQLPSKGKFWGESSIILNSNNEYEVYSMTAKDELLLKNPNTMGSGRAIATVIQSCIPSIKNALDAPSIDIDLILIAIRIATYGTQFNAPVEIDGRSYIYN